MHGEAGHVWQGGTHGRGHAWQEGMCGRGMCGADMFGRGMWGKGHAWQETRPLQRTVRILLECILVKVAEFPKLALIHGILLSLFI